MFVQTVDSEPTDTVIFKKMIHPSARFSDLTESNYFFFKSMHINQVLVVELGLTCDVWALNPVWDISISMGEVEFPPVAEEMKSSD